MDGTGLIKQPEDQRDYLFGFVASVAEPINWNQEFRLPEPPNEHQGSSDSCVSHATSYFHWQLKGKDYSRRDLFSRIAHSYGANLRDGVKQICSTGHQTKDECPDPVKQTMSNMRVKSPLPNAGLDDLESNYFAAGGHIDQIAQAVRDFNGAVFGLSVGSTGWEDKTNPKPPRPNNPGIGHAIYAFGYHMHDGKKCIIAKSSWCTPSHHEHHIKEDYFNSGYTFNGWVLVPKDYEMIKKYKINSNGKLGIMIDYGFTAIIHYAKSMEMYNQLLSNYEVPQDAQQINI